jgi:hypothetical protein
MKNGLVLPDPGRQLLLDDLPYAIFTLHSQNDTVPTVVADIDCEQSFLQSIRLAEVELPQPAIGFNEFGKLDIPDKLYLHKAPFELLLTILVLSSGQVS